jgi:hypothetical protein
LNKTIFVNIFQVQRLLEAQMELIQQQVISHGESPYLAQQEQTLSNQILERHNQEEIIWRKNSRVKWLKEGERITEFFHPSMIQRRHSNLITHLISEQGNNLTSHYDIGKKLTTFFQDLLD